MDATHDVAPRPSAPEAADYPPTAADLRRNIHDTTQALRGHVSQLQGYVHTRLGSLENPLHVRERVAARPFLCCAVALSVGVLLGTSRRAPRPVPRLVVQGVRRASGVAFAGIGKTVGAQLVSALFRRG